MNAQEGENMWLRCSLRRATPKPEWTITRRCGRVYVIGPWQIENGTFGLRVDVRAKTARGMRIIPLLCLLAVLGGRDAAAQTLRGDWKQLDSSSLDWKVHLEHSLAEAPLTSGERAQIYRVIDNKTIHDSFTDAQRDEERKTVMSARVGSIALAEDGSQQVLVQGPALFCGANYNCSIWIFVRRRGHLQLALATGGGAFIVRNTSSQGFRDLATGWHMSGDEERFGVYRWNGIKYEQIDCYNAKFDWNDRDKPPVITDCGKKPI